MVCDQHNNLSPAEKEALIRLSKRRDIEAADKGGAVVVWSRTLYIAEANRQLSDGGFYERLDHDPLKENQIVVKTTITEMIRDNKLPPLAKGLIVPTPQNLRFYLLPKIHEVGSPGRPTVLGVLLSHRKYNFLLGSDYVPPCAQSWDLYKGYQPHLSNLHCFPF